MSTKPLTYFARLKSSTGFTLVEILVAVVIVVILTTVGIASFTSASQSNEMRQQGQEIKSLARNLRTQALAASKPADTLSTCNTSGAIYGSYINFTDGSNTVRHGISCWSPESDTTDTDYSAVASQTNLKPNITVSGLTGGSTNLTIFFTFDNRVFFFDCNIDCTGGNNSGIAPNRDAIIDATNTGATTVPGNIQRVELSNGNADYDYQVNFSVTGLVCEERAGDNICAD